MFGGLHTANTMNTTTHNIQVHHTTADKVWKSHCDEVMHMAASSRLTGNGGRGGHPQNEVRKIQDIIVLVGYLGDHPC